MARSEAWAQLGTELCSIRTLAGLSQRDVVEKTGISQSSVSRMERGDAPPTRAETLAWLTAAEADEGVRRRVLALTEAAHTDPTAYEEFGVAASNSQKPGPTSPTAWRRRPCRSFPAAERGAGAQLGPVL